jgi:DNA-binding NtrC family response regulator
LDESASQAGDSPQIAAIVVDDDTFALRFMEKALHRFGVTRVRSCQTGPDALRAIGDMGDARLLLIVDLNMPDMDGIEFLRQLARHKFRGAVLLHSGADATVREAATKLVAAYGLDFMGTFVKPIPLDRLGAIVAKMQGRAAG